MYTPSIAFASPRYAPFVASDYGRCILFALSTILLHLPCLPAAPHLLRSPTPTAPTLTWGTFTHLLGLGRAPPTIGQLDTQTECASPPVSACLFGSLGVRASVMHWKYRSHHPEVFIYLFGEGNGVAPPGAVCRTPVWYAYCMSVGLYARPTH